MNNGGTWGTSSSLSGIFTDTFVYLIGSAWDGESVFDSMFGTTGIFANRALVSATISGNGNDGFRIMDGTTVIDQVWKMDANDVCMDSYMYRIDGTGPDGGWIASNWYMPSNGVLDGLSEAEQAAAVGLGSYVPCTLETSVDFYENCQIDFLDLGIFLAGWLDCNLEPPEACWE